MHYHFKVYKDAKGYRAECVAHKMGFKNLYSYQRLESSKTANPEFSTLLQIKKVFPEFEVDELLSA